MNRKMYLMFLAFFSFTFLQAQKGPLRGSGNIVKVNHALEDFTSIQLLDLSGVVNVTVGKPFSINIQIDDNLLPLLETAVNNSELSVKLANNLNNKLYIEQTNIKIMINLPELKTVKHRGNDFLTITGISGKSFSLKNFGNGNVKLEGEADELEISKSGNGDVIAKELKVQKATILSTGNGDVLINATASFKANGSGNGDIKQVGIGRLSEGSAKSGNGKIIFATNN